MSGSGESNDARHGDLSSIDALLEELLELALEQRSERIEQIRRDSEQLAGTLERLILAADDQQGLEKALAGAFKLIAGSEREPPPEQLGSWRLVREIGQGGMATVYLAERTEADFKQQAAVKLMHAGFGSASIRERFVRERNILARLSDPRIARLFDGGESDDGRFWLAMEYVDGLPIDRYCKDASVELEQRLALFEQVVSAVDHAHRHLIIHRDIKPSNVLVTADGQVRLLDFGIAKLLGEDPESEAPVTLTQALTPRYASPEQRAGESVSTASDVFQLGLLLFQLVTGCQPGSPLPRASDALRQRLQDQGCNRREAHRQTRALRGDLDHIIERATALRPDDRYPSCERLRADLEYRREGWPITARANERWYRLRRFVRRHRFASGMLTVAVFASLAYALLAMEHSRAIQAEADKATAVRDFVIELFQQADPGHTLGEELPVGRVLKRGRERIELALHDQPATRAELLLTLGELYQALGEHAQSESLLREAIDSAVAGRNRDGEFRARLALARVLGGESRYPEARQAAETALTSARETHEIALVQAEQGYLLLKMGQPEEAEPILRQSFQRYRKLPDHEISRIELSRMQTYLAYSELILGQTDDAERQLLAARERFVAELGPDHPEVQAVSYTLARISELRGDWPRAAREMRAVVDTETRVLGAGHREVGISRTRLAHILLAQERWDEATAEFSAAQAILEASTEGPQFFLADNLKGQAELALAIGNYREAERILPKAIAQFEVLLDWPDWRLADAYRLKATLYMAAGDCKGARSLLDQARDPMLIRPEPYPSRWQRAWERLNELESADCRPGGSHLDK